MVTAREAIHFTQQKSIVVVEDTHTSFMSDFSQHGDHTFHRYAKDSTDALTARNACIYPSRFDEIKNQAAVDHYNKVHSIQFFPSLIAFKVDPGLYIDPAVIWNKRENIPIDYRHQGGNQAEVNWPDPFQNTSVVIKGS